MKKIIIYNQFHLGVWSSELLNYLKYGKTGVDTVYSFYSVRKFLRHKKVIRENIHSLHKESGTNVKLFIMPVLLNKLIIKLYIRLVIAPFSLHKNVKYIFEGFYYSGGYVAVLMAEYFHAYSIFNMRSVEDTEVQESLPGSPRKEHVVRKLKDVLLYNISAAHEIIVVSQKMKDYVLRYKAKVSVRINPLLISVNFISSVNHCKQFRNELGIPENSIVFLYAGSAAAHQMISYTFELYNEIYKQGGNVTLLVLSGELEAMQKELAPYRFNYVLRSVKHTEIGRYLSCADYGFLLRGPSLINNVASPTKFAEYLISGLSVITTSAAGDYSGMVKSFGLGIQVPHNNAKQAAMLILTDMNEMNYLQKATRNSFAYDNLTWENYTPEKYFSIITEIENQKVR